MIKLVASDLDGTLLHNYQQTVPKEIYDTIKALHRKRNHLHCRKRTPVCQYPQVFSLLSALTFHISLKMVPCASIKKKYSPPV